jgi:hypothetical protein
MAVDERLDGVLEALRFIREDKVAAVLEPEQLRAQARADLSMFS